jgi:hypothetical protein
MTATETDPEFCHCGQPLHYTDPMAESFTRGLVENLGPTLKVSAMGHVYEVQRHYIALHGLRAADLPSLGFPEVEVEGGVGDMSLTDSGGLEPFPAPLEGDESDEALLAYQEELERSTTRVGGLDDLGAGPPRGSPMRSKLPQGEGELSILLQRAREARGSLDEPNAYMDLVESIAEFLLEQQ